ncbi:predicted protein [Chaetomium globosum CBS 148.51]|uniref:Uncharacterized protein n=1 Tax=Chaetomium globosum (strain ATCC 6205 / CBS 148.51 / DSM 1962 / NBRC 6347 / NRRL 1970) TaxID=306901 RepID=Q2GS39_CHAGB|nr:uncharacterized protein CHGG_09215 [Chaetomium globosum CBS 148.51]EAQ85201.1 predicted protein [Chaetomium globosum CBS 148.51]
MGKTDRKWRAMKEDLVEERRRAISLARTDRKPWPSPATEPLFLTG